MQIHNQITKAFEKLTPAKAPGNAPKDSQATTPEESKLGPVTPVQDTLQKTEVKAGSVPATQPFVEEAETDRIVVPIPPDCPFPVPIHGGMPCQPPVLPFPPQPLHPPGGAIPGVVDGVGGGLPKPPKPPK